MWFNSRNPHPHGRISSYGVYWLTGRTKYCLIVHRKNLLEIVLVHIRNSSSFRLRRIMDSSYLWWVLWKQKISLDHLLQVLFHSASKMRISVTFISGSYCKFPNPVLCLFSRHVLKKLRSISMSSHETTWLNLQILTKFGAGYLHWN
jgi:hypothetical protein